MNYPIAQMERAVEATSDDSGIQENTSFSSDSSGTARPRYARGSPQNTRSFRNKKVYQGKSNQGQPRPKKQFRLQIEDFPCILETRIPCDQPSSQQAEERRVGEERQDVKSHLQNTQGE